VQPKVVGGGRLTPGTPQIAVATEGESMYWKNLCDNSIQLRAMSRRRKNLKNLLYVSYEGMRQIEVHFNFSHG
jgi:hypothetical protein